MVRTKIICTIGPSVNSVEMITSLVKAGMNVARLNFSHGTHEEHLVVINNIKKVRKDLDIPLAIVLDTKGPEIRLGKVKNNQILVVPGSRLILAKSNNEDDENKLIIRPDFIIDNLEPGMSVLFDDGYISSKVIERVDSGVLIEIENGGIIKSGKGVNIPNGSFNLPVITEKDIEDIRFGCLHGVDIIAASFVRSANHVLTIKKLLSDEKKSDILVMAKIENREGVDNFDSIVQVSDGIMIARGDLGVEVPLSHVPRLQKMMIRKCYLAGKPSITATQMLESMINNPRPTRAEASDVANAIYDGTSAVMLSGETAVGKYPLETVAMMRSIVDEAENDIDYRDFFALHTDLVYHDVPSSLTLAAVKTGYSSNAKAIFVFTNSGSTARLVSRLRPGMIIVAMTTSQTCYHQLSINWGIIPMLGKHYNSIIEAFKALSDFALEKELVSNGDLVVITAGSPFGVSGTTNMMLVENIGDVLVRGESGSGTRLHGNVALVLSSEAKQPYEVSNQLLVITRCDESYIPLMIESAGVILQNHIDDSASEAFALQKALELNKPIIVRADAAANILKEGQLVTLDPEKALVYKGVIY